MRFVAKLVSGIPVLRDSPVILREQAWQAQENVSSLLEHLRVAAPRDQMEVALRSDHTDAAIATAKALGEYLKTSPLVNTNYAKPWTLERLDKISVEVADVVLILVGSEVCVARSYESICDSCNTEKSNRGQKNLEGFLVDRELKKVLLLTQPVETA
jgi:hypothetical protein